MNDFDGKDFNIFVEGQPIYGATNATLSLTSDRLDANNKDSGGFAAGIPGDYSGTISVPSLFTNETIAGKRNIGYVVKTQLDRTKVTAALRRAAADDTRISKYILGDAYIGETVLTFNKNEIANVSTTIQLTGEISTLNESS
jgi:hypothetical protein